MGCFKFTGASGRISAKANFPAPFVGAGYRFIGCGAPVRTGFKALAEELGAFVFTLWKWTCRDASRWKTP
uniref:Uncharacterized protein n=1 Tax=Neisseria meningitidis alpha275 TaxID=295996 RepID=C6SHP3_NEIME|nr:hypothetical protein predicted by Glimmer/Critica [Neisseria meningitidis alpha275]